MTPERTVELSKVFRKRIQDLMKSCSEEIKTDSIDAMMCLISQFAHSIGENVSILSSVGVPAEITGLLVNESITTGYLAHRDFLVKQEQQEKERKDQADFHKRQMN